MARSFDVNGLDGYRVVLGYDGRWEVRVTGVVTFGWDGSAHTIPEHREDYAVGAAGLGFKTAKAAVAYAHKHAAWVREKMPA